MKNQPAIRRLLAANFISGIAQGITMITIPMYFASIGMGNQFTLIYLLLTFVGLFWNLYAGTLVDKYNRQTLFWTFNLACALILSSLAIWAFWQGGVSPLIAFLAFMMTFFYYGIHFNSFYAFMQEISEQGNYGKVASLIEIQVQLGSALAGGAAALLWQGGSIGGWIIPKIELSQILAINAGTYFVAFLLLKFLRYEVVAERKAESGNLLERLGVGWQWLRDNPNVAWFGVLSLSVFVLVMVGTYSLNTVYANQVIKSGEHVYALSEMFFAVGAMGAGAFMQRLFRNYDTFQAIILLNSLTVIKCVILVFFYQEWIFYSCCFLLGLSNAGIRVLRLPLLFKIIPNQIQGRVSSLFGISNTLLRMVFLSIFSLPFFHQNDQIKYSFAVFGIFLLFVSIALIRLRFILNNQLQASSSLTN